MQIVMIIIFTAHESGEGTQTRSIEETLPYRCLLRPELT